ncbi:MAG: hypothetical protein AABX19_04130 [Nanoarchaeota archaeon]
MTTEAKILQELKAIRQDLDYLKENMAEKNMFLSTEEKQLLEESFKNEKENKLVSSKDLKKQLGL